MQCGALSRSLHFCAVVALSLFDLRKRGFVDDLYLAGTNGKKLPEIRGHMQRAIGEVYSASHFDLSVHTFPGDNEVNSEAYITALDVMPKGSAVTVFTPVRRLPYKFPASLFMG
jgi:D-galacturonate reductase